MGQGLTPGKLEELMDRSAQAAMDALRRYKFERFGYHASQWVMLNKLLEKPRPSPFRRLVQAAREETGFRKKTEEEKKQ